MDELITLTINGQPATVAAGTSVAAAIAIAAASAAAAAVEADVPASAPAATTAHAAGATRRSVSGELRAPLCGMGICQECRVTVDGRQHILSCQTPCKPGMQVETAA